MVSEIQSYRDQIMSWRRLPRRLVRAMEARVPMLHRARLRATRPIVRLRHEAPRRPVIEHSPFTNIYHTCTQRTASQWFRNIFYDPAVWAYTGLGVEPFKEFGHRRARIETPFPEDTFVTGLYINYPTYETIPKSDSYRTFFVLRDPRDAIVSLYFSMKYSHTPFVKEVATLRSELRLLDPEAGMHYLIDWLDDIGFFETQLSWVQQPQAEQVRILRYEDLAADNEGFLEGLFEYLEIRMPESELEHLISRHSFAKYTRGREQGDEDRYHHYRRGISGEWVDQFTPSLVEHFRAATGNTLEQLGYIW